MVVGLVVNYKKVFAGFSGQYEARCYNMSRSDVFNSERYFIDVNKRNEEKARKHL